MAARLTRRRFVGRLARSAAAATSITLGLLALGRPAPARASLTISASTQKPAPSTLAVPVRISDLVLEGRDLRAGLADGVRLPAQGGDAWGLSAERPGGTYTTPPLEAEFPSTHVGVHWRTDGGDQAGLKLEVRASRDGQTWLPWRRVRVERHGPDRAPDGPATETFGALVGARLGTWLQARVTFEVAAPETATIHALTLTCLDSRRGPAPEPAAAAPASPSAEMLRAGLVGFLDRVVSREAWGADESLRFKDGKDQWPTAFVTPSLLVVHHTATETEYAGGDAEAEVRAIYAYHAVTQGWGDIGYHLLIDSSGRVYEGRRGREPDASGVREIVSSDVVAGHALDYNYGSVGIALLGNFQEREPGRAMLDSLVEALAFQASRYGIDPTTRIEYLRAKGDSSSMWRNALSSLSGHRDCIPTECPGDNVYTLLPALRAQVDEQLGARGPSVQPVQYPGRLSAWPPDDLTFRWPAAGPVEISTRLAGWRRIPGSDKIEALAGYDPDERPIWGPWTTERALSVQLPPDAHGIYTLFARARDASGRESRVWWRLPLAVGHQVEVDDGVPGDLGWEGTWQESREILGYAGIGYHETAAPDPDARFRWQATVPESGMYQVQASWTDAPNRTARAIYRLRQADQVLAEATVDQRQSGGAWVGLGEATLAARTPYFVELSGADDGVLVADAIRLVLEE